MMTIEDYFDVNRTLALAFSGGTDSAYLLYEAVKSGADVCPFFVKSQFTPEFEVRDAQDFCKSLGVKLQIIELNILNVAGAAANGHDRCYHCKHAMMDAITSEMSRYGFMLLIDGTNASDSFDDRPGMRALSEYKVQSPLRMAGMTKEMIRERSRKAGLKTSDKPSYSCLATRFPENFRLTADALKKLELCEDAIAAMGLTGFRLRISENGSTKLQVRRDEFEKAIALSGRMRQVVEQHFNSFDIDKTVFR